jgi:putative aldouronate transport system permease protein
MGLMVLVFLYPFLDTVSLSLARPETANRLGMRFLPDFPVSFDAYREVATNRYVFIAFGNTLFRTIIGSTLSTFTTFCGAFVLAKRGLPFKKAITSVILFTMFFSGGLIPSYLLMRSLHLVGSRWALILPGLTSAWNLFIARNFMITIPQSMEEAAIMDGAGVYTTMFRIILPLSMPIIAVLFLWSGVGHWNAYFDAMIYTPSNDKLVLQLLLRRILIDNTAEALIGNVLMASAQETTPETVKAATIIVAIAPILCVYPFLQKYFVKGINIGAIKG